MLTDSITNYYYYQPIAWVISHDNLHLNFLKNVEIKISHGLLTNFLISLRKFCYEETFYSFKFLCVHKFNVNAVLKMVASCLALVRI